MPEKQTRQAAERDLRAGRSPSTAAGEFVREEIEHVRKGKHGARSPKQAIAIGLSKARRAGIPLKPPKSGVGHRTRRAAELAYEEGQHRREPRAPSRARVRAVERALRREAHGTTSRRQLSAQAHRAAARRSPAARHASARKAARTKGAAGRRAAARKAARTRAAAH